MRYPGGTVGGGDDGVCAGWDPRAHGCARRRAAWTHEVCPGGHGVAGLALMCCGRRVAAACADGFLRLLVGPCTLTPGSCS